MGFLKNLFDEAGSKAGRAIGNKLFPRSTDYVRLGDLDGNPSEAIRAQSQAEQERIAAQLLADKMRFVMDLDFNASDIDHNLNVLAQLETIIESLPRRFDRSYEEQRLYKAALAKMKAGIALCRAKDPDNEALAYFAEKY
jgi:hypothetical protein